MDGKGKHTKLVLDHAVDGCLGKEKNAGVVLRLEISSKRMGTRLNPNCAMHVPSFS